MHMHSRVFWQVGGKVLLNMSRLTFTWTQHNTC